MNYKTLNIDDDSYELGKSNQLDDFFVDKQDKEENIELQILDLFKDVDKINIEKRTISVIDRFCEYIKNSDRNSNSFTKLTLFQQNKIILFIIKHAFEKYTIKIRESSFQCIVAILVLYPQFTELLISKGYFFLLNNAFQSSLSNEENRILLFPAYKSFGNLLHNNDDMIIKKIFANTDIDSFIRSTTVLEPKDSECTNYAISCIFRQSTIQLNEEHIIQLLITLNNTLCSLINEETCSNYLHSYALTAIDLFVKSDLYDITIKQKGIIESKIDTSIDRYFEVEEGLIREKCLSLSIISTFYKLKIPDKKNLIEKIIPFLIYIIENQEPGGRDVYQERSTGEQQQTKHTQRTKNIRRLCDSIKEILESPSGSNALEYFYSIDALDALYQSIDNTKKLTEKLFITSTIAFFAETNSKFPELPFHDFFFSENCIETFLDLLDGDDNDFNFQVLKGFYAIFDYASKIGNIYSYIELFTNLDGIETLENLTQSENTDVNAYALLLLRFLEPYL